jgi:nucleolar GTP-binding protein
MTFVTLSKIADSSIMLDLAFRSARERRDFAHKDIIGRKDIGRLDKSIRAEKQRVFGAGKSLRRQLMAIHDNFPSFNHLAPFYQELISTVVDMDTLRNSLGAVKWAAERVDTLTQTYANQIERCKELDKINAMRRAFYGRCASTLKQIDKNLAELERCRKAFKDLPTLKTSIFTVVIAGVPNVGKSTLLHAITGAKPEIKPYPFTTKHLMLGYSKIDDNEVQFVDTPGILDRPLHKRNAVEVRAALAMTHVANAIIFIIDPTLQSGFPLEEQRRLLTDTRKQFKVPFIIIINKSDVATKEEKDAVADLKPIAISAKSKEGIEDVRKALKRLF